MQRPGLSASAVAKMATQGEENRKQLLVTEAGWS